MLVSFLFNFSSLQACTGDLLTFFFLHLWQDYCKRGKVEHLIRMRERLDEHSKFLESQLAGLESLVEERGESDVIVPAMPESDQDLAE